MSKLTEKLQNKLHFVNNWFNKISTREKFLAIAMLLIALLIGTEFAYTKISTALTLQKEKLSLLEMYNQELPYVLARFKELEIKQSNIEKEYEEVTLSEGGLSHIENILKTKAEAASNSDFQIRPNPSSSKNNLNSNYKQESYSVDFKVRSFKALAATLKEITRGKKPMILSDLDVNKSPSGELLNVALKLTILQKLDSKEVIPNTTTPVFN